MDKLPYMGENVKRLISLDFPISKTVFLWGPRKTGKSFLIRSFFKKEILIDLLKSEVFAEYATRPSLLRERFSEVRSRIVIDEVQKVPALLDEVQWLIENKGLSFLLTGSSARKLKRGQANLLGGRAWRRTLCPFSWCEVRDRLNLEKAMVSGFLPSHFFSPNPIEDLRGYVADYLKEEIAGEAQMQNIPAFSEFLRVAALSNAELIQYSNIGREAGVSPKVVRHYFSILEETFLGYRLAPWKKSKNRRMILTEKFYFFDLGVSHYLAKKKPQLGSVEFGKAFEHFILMELKAYQAYRNPEMDISFWRTSQGEEVDFVLGDLEVAIEVKTSVRVDDRSLRAIQGLLEEKKTTKAYVICFEREPRKLGSIEILPWEFFLSQLWAGGVFPS